MEAASDPNRIFGWIAVSLSLVYKFPQIYRLFKTRETAGISVLSQLVQASAYFFYVTHGIIIGDPPIIFLGITSLIQSLVLVAQYFAYRNHSERKKGQQELETRSDHSDEEGKQEKGIAQLIDTGLEPRVQTDVVPDEYSVV